MPLLGLLAVAFCNLGTPTVKGLPQPKLVAKIVAGKILRELGFTTGAIPTHQSVKEAVSPFSTFPGVDIILGPEMESTGEVMGIDADRGFSWYATPGAGQVVTDAVIPVNILPKLTSGQRPNVIDLMRNKDMAMVINTPSGKNTREDEVKIRTATMQNRIPIMTTLRDADMALKAIKSLQGSEVSVTALQEYHK